MSRRGKLLTRKAPPRVAPKPGQTYEQANPGRFVGISSEVAEIKRRVESTWPSLEFIVDGFEQEFVIVEHTEKDGEKLCFAIPFEEGLNEEKLMKRIWLADAAQQEGMDLADHFEKEQDEIWRRQEKEQEDKLGDAGERLLHALKKDGVDAGIPKIFPGEKRSREGRRGIGRKLIEDSA
jgi:hypothetical protein